MIGTLRGAGFPMPTVARAFGALDSHTYGFTLQEQAWAVDPSETPEVAAAFAAMLPEGRYPNVEAMAEFAMTSTDGVPIDFEFGLDLLLDGLERLLPPGPRDRAGRLPSSRDSRRPDATAAGDVPPRRHLRLYRVPATASPRAHRAIIIEADEPPPAYALLSSLLDAMVDVAGPGSGSRSSRATRCSPSPTTRRRSAARRVIDCLRACHAAFLRPARGRQGRPGPAPATRAAGSTTWA